MTGHFRRCKYLDFGPEGPSRRRTRYFHRATTTNPGPDQFGYRGTHTAHVRTLAAQWKLPRQLIGSLPCNSQWPSAVGYCCAHRRQNKTPNNSGYSERASEGLGRLVCHPDPGQHPTCSNGHGFDRKATASQLFRQPKTTGAKRPSPGRLRDSPSATRTWSRGHARQFRRTSASANDGLMS